MTPRRLAAARGDRRFAIPASLGFSSTWNSIAQVAALGVRVDRSRGRSEPAAALPPEDDAFLVDEAVQSLATATISMPDGFDVLGDLDWLTDDERSHSHKLGFDIARARGDQLVALVRRLAVIGGVPDFEAYGPVERKPVRSANGREAWFRMMDREVPLVDGSTMLVPIEVSGYDEKRKRPHRDAYRKTILTPCPSLLVGDRIDYQAWVLSLGLIVEQLSGRLEGFDPQPPLAPAWPWEGEMARPRPTIRCVRAMQMEDAAVA